jgi:hypothetical protein
MMKLNTVAYNRKSTSFVWVPSHIGIAGNTAADATAKAALSLQLCETMVPYSDFKPLVAIYVKGVWQKSWDIENNNKLHCIKPVIAGGLQYITASKNYNMICKITIYFKSAQILMARNIISQIIS